MLQQRKIGSVTELYTENGGGITQSFPTQFREFWHTKILTANDNIENYREASAAEKQAWESTHTEPYQSPPLAFIDIWNNASGKYGKYNDETGYFELNGLIDITYEEAINIYNNRIVFPFASRIDSGTNIRTNLICFNTPLNLLDATPDVGSFIRNNYIKVLNISSLSPSYNLRPYHCANFISSSSLTKVIGILDLFYVSNTLNLIRSAPLLETFFILNVKCNLSLGSAPKLNLESFEYLVTNAVNTIPIAITVHPDVYAKLTNDTANAAAAALTPEEAVQWQQLVADASAKQITFVTA